jgi:hypothetical protein
VAPDVVSPSRLFGLSSSFKAVGSIGKPIISCPVLLIYYSRKQKEYTEVSELNLAEASTKYSALNSVVIAVFRLLSLFRKNEIKEVYKITLPLFVHHYLY